MRESECRWNAGFPGTLDIHHISTGRGNATFFVLPDGTTLLVDAGAAGDGLPETDPASGCDPHAGRVDRSISYAPYATGPG